MAQLLILIVKGNRREAEEAAAAHNIPFVFNRERERVSETWGYVDERHIDAVRSWHNEPKKKTWLTGMWPIGTLLGWEKAAPLHTRHGAKHADGVAAVSQLIQSG